MIKATFSLLIQIKSDLFISCIIHRTRIALSIKIIIMVYELNLFLKIKYNPNIPINTHVIHEVIIFIPVFGNSFRGFSGLVLLSLG